MISVQTLSETFFLPYTPDLPLSIQIQRYNPDYHVDFQHLVNLKTETPISDEDRLEDGDSVGLIMLNDINVELEEEMPVGGETHYMVMWTPSHIEYGESSEAQLGYESIVVVYDQWDEKNPFFYSLSGKYNKKHKSIEVMLEEDIECNWPPIQRDTLIKNITKLIKDYLQVEL